ncbi:MAG: ATP-binding protein [Lachnospiraceae bacterium]|nr:ATP-binding protein [Lachnospiraceae bacterium]
MIVNREKEMDLLKAAVRDDYSHFIAVYGRRRIGKTFLVREAFGYRFTFQHAGLSKGGLKEQLFGFEASIMNAGGVPSADPKNWLEAFEDLKELIRESKEERKVIFIDELSWMDTQNSDLMTALENFWNGWASARRDVILIICSSATSWMLEKVIHNKGGLYNRLTEKIRLDTFTLGECEKFLQEEGMKLNRDQILQFYMVFGGVPFYWTFIEKGSSIPRNIDRILFEENAPLKDEFDHLYASIFRKPRTYIDIISTLSRKKAGMTREELIAESGIPNSGDLSKKLDELESCGFIKTYTSYGKKKKATVYQLIDFFTLFYYQFIEAGTTDERFWSDQINTPRVNTWQGLAFERVALRHVQQIKNRLGIAGINTEVNSWYASPDKETGMPGAQIDLLIVRKDQVINLCEIKYSSSEYRVTGEDDGKLRRKVEVFRQRTKTRYAVFPTLITTYGLVDNSYALNFQSVITMDDLFG